MSRPWWRKALRGVLRSAVFLAVLGAALAAFAWLSLRFVFTPEHLRYLLADQLEAALRRPVRMEAMRFDLTGALRIEGFKLLRKDEPWAEPLIESDRFSARFRYWTLLTKGRIVIDEVFLQSATIRLVRRADGTWTLQDLFERRRTGAPGGKVALSVAEAKISDGRVTVIDEMKGTRWSADQIQFRVSKLREEGAFPFELSFASENTVFGRALTGSADIEGSVDLGGFDWKRARLDVRRLRLRVPQGRATLRGTLSDFSRPRGEFKLQVSPLQGADFDFSQLARLSLPGLDASVSFEVPSPGAVVVRAFKITDAKSSITGDASYQPGGDPSWSLRLRSPGLELSGLAAYWPGLASYELEGQLRFETSVSSGPAGLRWGRSRASVEGYRAVFGIARIREANAEFSALPDLRKARVRLNRTSLRVVGSADLTGLSADAEISGPDWTFRRVKGVWNGMRWTLRGRVEQFFAPKKIELEGGADVIHIQEVVNLVASIIEYNKARATRPAPERRKWFEYFKYGVSREFPAIAGHLKADRVAYDYLNSKNFAILFDVQGLAHGMKDLNGTVQYEMGPGELLKIAEMRKNSKFLNVIFLPFVTLDQIQTMGIMKGWRQQDRLAYSRIYGNYRATWGNVRIDPLLVDTEEILLHADGQMDLPHETINLYVLNRLHKARGTLPETLTCDDGKPCLAFFVEGDLGLPEATLDLNKIRTEKGTRVLKSRLDQLKILKKLIPVEDGL